jgi:hypothetical protein
MFRIGRRGVCFATISFAFIALIIALSCAIASAFNKINCSLTCFFIYYSIEEDEVSASSISTLVTNLGGAGEIIECDGVYYITIACYYKQEEAKLISDNLSNSGVNCGILKRTLSSVKLRSGNAVNNRQKYEDNINALISIANICYEAANNMDIGKVAPDNALQIVNDIKSSLSGLYAQNAANCFADILKRLIAECNNICVGNIKSCDMRRLQIIVIDGVFNIKLT